jgi:hypothetical protein
VVLAGSVPALGFYGADGNGTDDTRGKQQVRPGRARAALMRATDTSDDDALGFTDAKRKPHEDVLWILVRNLAEGDAVEFFVEDEAGTMVSAGTGTADADGHAALHSSTADGGALPLNAWSVDDLAGQRVEVRAAGGATILYGIVPQATTRAVKYRARATIEDDDSPATAEVQMFIDPRAGRERLRIDVQGLGSDDQAMELWMDDGTGTSTFVLVESKDPPVGDQARFQWDTKSGQALPLQAETLKDLQGRAFEIRVNGTAALSGSLPSF